MPTFGPATTVPMMVGMCRIVAFITTSGMNP